MLAMKFVAIAALVALAAAAPPNERQREAVAREAAEINREAVEGIIERLPGQFREGERVAEERLREERLREERLREERRHVGGEHHEQVHREHAKIEEQSRVGPNKDGSWSQSFKTSNGIRVHEAGKQVPSEKKDNKYGTANFVEGNVAYKGKDGKEYELKYVADENGYRPSAEYLPTPPPMSDAIRRSIAHNAAHPNHEGQDGQYHPRGWNNKKVVEVVVEEPRRVESRYSAPHREESRPVVPHREVPRYEPAHPVVPHREVPRYEPAHPVVPRYEVPRREEHRWDARHH